MSKPTEEERHENYYHDTFLFYQALAALKGPEEVRSFMEDLLTSSESRMLRRRWHVARLLKRGGSVREVAYNAKVGTDTVVRVSKRLKKGGILTKVLDSLSKKEGTKPPSASSRYIYG